MNIQNLNQQELEQLQTLLNKMNPQPFKAPDHEPINEMIAGIMDEFDFGRVQKAMDCLDWKWLGEEVSIGMLRTESRRLLRNAAEARLGSFKDTHWGQGIACGTGGLEAKAWCDESKTKITALELKFILAAWDESIED